MRYAQMLHEPLKIAAETGRLPVKDVSGVRALFSMEHQYIAQMFPMHRKPWYVRFRHWLNEVVLP